MQKKDFLLGVAAGFFTGIFILPIIKNIKVEVAYFLFLLPIGIPLLWMLALMVGRFLSRWLSWIYQFVKFSIVGFFNASIDFGVLNLMSLYTGLTKGLIIGGVNVPGFFLASTSSYFLNKFWVFAKKYQEGESAGYKDLLTFIPVVLLGVFLNSGVVVLISTYIPPAFDLSPERWLNIAKVAASATALAWNFLGFKFFVFKA